MRLQHEERDAGPRAEQHGRADDVQVLQHQVIRASWGPSAILDDGERIKLRAMSGRVMVARNGGLWHIACISRRMAARALIGISGWRYTPWRGDFYPPGLPQNDELRFAAERFPTIELNGSFYSLQRPE